MTPPPVSTDGVDIVRDLVAALPEVYQPIYGRPDVGSSRTPDAPRIGALLHIVDLLAARYDRPLRVLDLGTAQAYVACTIAARGHHVTGIEFLPANVAVCEAIAAEHPELDVGFVLGDVADVKSLVDLADFDLVVALSVLHHVTHREGHDATVALVERLATHIPHGIFELALAAEPPYWAAAQPASPRSTLAAFPFIRELALSGTHLSDVERPTYFCSRTDALVNGALHDIRSWSSNSHDHAGEQQAQAMRYFMLDGLITKIAAPTSDSVPDGIVQSLRDDLRREATMLDALARAGLEVPAIVELSDRADETVLTRETYEGRLVSEMMSTLTAGERQAITSQVLAQLAELEAHGLYHADLRLWNVLFDRDGCRARLIDFGAIRTEPVDVMPPGDGFASFAVFVGSLWASHPDQTGLHLPRALDIDAAEVPAPVVDLIVALLTHPRDGAVFADLAQRWEAGSGDEPPALWPVVPIAWECLRSAHEFAVRINADVRSLNELVVAQQARIDALDAARQHLESVAQHQLAELDGLREGLRAVDVQRQFHADAHDAIAAFAADQNQHAVAHVAHLETVIAGLRGQLAEAGERNDALDEQARTLNEALAATHRSLSWRVTSPLRHLRHPRQALRR